MGRPLHPRRQRGARIHGVPDLRLRRRASGHLGAGRHLLGSRGLLAGRRTLQRRAPAAQRAGRRADGPDLRQPRGSQRQARSAGVSPRHPRDLRTHGDERRGDGGPDRRGPHLRQDPRSGRPILCRPRTGERADRGPGAGLAQPARHGRRTRCDNRGPGSHLEPDPDALEQPLFRKPVRVRMGAHQEPGGGLPVAGQGRRADHSGRPRRRPEACAHHADLRPGPAYGPCVRGDFPPVSRKPRSVRRRLRESLVQADPPRHGTDCPLPRPARAEGDADLAGSDPGGGPPADRRGGHRVAQIQDPRERPLDPAAGVHGLGFGLDLPQLRQARRRQWRADSAGPAEGLGGQRPG